MKKPNKGTARTQPAARRDGGPGKKANGQHSANHQAKSGNSSSNRGKTRYQKEASQPGNRKHKGGKPINEGAQAPQNPGARPAKKTVAPQYDFKKIKALTERRRQQPKDGQEELIRLNRYIANAGVCSRREADVLIAEGRVRINGKVVTELGRRVSKDDKVKLDGKLLQTEKMVYVLLNKPKDYITTTEDPQQRRTVMELVANACDERIVPVGRLDRNTTGLLLFTNDGELAKKLTHPSHKVKKLYQVEIDQPITKAHIDEIAAGLQLEDGPAYVNDLAVVTPDRKTLGIEIHIGRNRIVRRIFEHLGYQVTRLDRSVFAGLNKKDLPRGKWRFLSEKEVIRLKMIK